MIQKYLKSEVEMSLSRYDIGFNNPGIFGRVLNFSWLPDRDTIYVGSLHTACITHKVGALLTHVLYSYFPQVQIPGGINSCS